MIETLTKPDTLESQRRFWQSIRPDQRRRYWEAVYERKGVEYVRHHPLNGYHSGGRLVEPAPASPFNLPKHDIDYKVAFLHVSGEGIASVPPKLYPGAIAQGIVVGVDSKTILETSRK